MRIRHGSTFNKHARTLCLRSAGSSLVRFAAPWLLAWNNYRRRLSPDIVMPLCDVVKGLVSPTLQAGAAGV
jgi:hypothetical protein